jgi:hypothetical protein
MEVYVFLIIGKCVMFELWMSTSSYNTFALVINLINQNWVAYHIIIGLFV